MKTYVFGDIHGCYDEYIYSFNNLPLTFNKRDKKLSDRLIFLGDYIDRGPDSAKVINHLMTLQSNLGTDTVVCLKGNHEELMLEAIDYRNNSLWYLNGGEATISSFNGSIPNDVIEWVKGLPRYYQDTFNVYVHAGVDKYYRDLDHQIDREGGAADFTWVRKSFIRNPKPWIKRVIFGHTAFKEPLVDMDKNILGIDTGLVHNNKLTVYCVEDNKFYFTEKLK